MSHQPRQPTTDDLYRIADLADHAHAEMRAECPDLDILMSTAVYILARAAHDRALASKDPVQAMALIHHSIHTSFDMVLETWSIGHAMGLSTWKDLEKKRKDSQK
jgi:hypothetical protein